MIRFPALILLVGVIASGCVSRRHKQDALRNAEFQYQAIRQLAPVDVRSGEHSVGVKVAGYSYEYALLVPVAYGVSTATNLGLFTLNEVIQFGVPFIWWTGYQDKLNDLTIIAYDRGVSFDTVHDLFPTAPGGTSYTGWPDPSSPSRKRGDQP